MNKQTKNRTSPKTGLSKLGNATTVTTMESLVVVTTHLKDRQKLEKMKMS